jgi:hypothetical protein
MTFIRSNWIGTSLLLIGGGLCAAAITAYILEGESTTAMVAVVSTTKILAVASLLFNATGLIVMICKAGPGKLPQVLDKAVGQTSIANESQDSAISF